MINSIILDAGPLGSIAHPRPKPEIASWLLRLLDSGLAVFVPESAGNELHRNLLLEGLEESINRFNELKMALTYPPLNTEVMLRPQDSGQRPGSGGSLRTALKS